MAADSHDRWNRSGLAAADDTSAELVHPYYVAVHDATLLQKEAVLDDGGLVVDLGGGSGRLAERTRER